MKKILVLFLSFFFVTFSVAQRRINCTVKVRDSVFKEISTKDSTVIDPSIFLKKFDSLIMVYKIRAIYFVNNNTKVSHYLPWSRIMLINTKSKELLTDKFIGELTHAEQFSRKPLFYYSKAASDIFKSFVRSVLKRKKYKEESKKLMEERKCSSFLAYLWVSYLEEYNNTNSFEYEAHKIIEPKIRSILWGIPKIKERKIIADR